MSYKFGLMAQETTSELYVFLIEPNVKFLVTSRYFVTYRVTYPAKKETAAETEVAAFLTDLAWPTK